MVMFSETKLLHASLVSCLTRPIHLHFLLPLLLYPVSRSYLGSLLFLSLPSSILPSMISLFSTLLLPLAS